MENRKRTLPVFDAHASTGTLKPLPAIVSIEPKSPSIRRSLFVTLPAELISLVFLYALSGGINQPGLWEPIKRVRPLASITLVSRNWYNIATGTPQLWSTIIVTTQRWFPSENVALWLDRARNTKLDVHLLSDNPKIPRLQVEVWKKAVKMGRERIRSLNVIVGAADWARITPLFPTHLPALVSAKFFIMEASSNDGFLSLEQPSVEAPKLEQLITNSPACLNFALCPAMQDLEITRLEERQASAGAVWERIRRVIDKTPKLRRLKISSQQPSLLPPSSLQGFDLPSLKTLHLDLKGRVASVEFLSRICAPALHDITITSFSAEVPPPEPFPMIDLPSLRSIRLTNTSLRQSIWLLDHISYEGQGLSGSKLKVVVEMDVRDGKEEETDYDSVRRRLRKKYDLSIVWSPGVPYYTLRRW
ncbi:hypothetical protein FRC04_011248 [Tulasnella sp. 424]|nr:hypothetical protein FRC04_011248 [Tulasnella sp. 424]KAG8971791.1 hypothetical protein FRC05_010750 [Tulasnella sp. 425]